jgi:DNA topoisomerase-1
MVDKLKIHSTRSAGVLPARSAAGIAGLIYSQESRRGLHRVRSGRGFRYVGIDGHPISDRATLDRIRSLAIPPAWTEVWICPKARGHLQATGRDARGRKQYRYHPRWRATRDETKFERMLEFGRALPKIRSRVAADLRRHGLSREKVLAAVIRLLETTLIRVGNEEYCRENHSFGLTTLRDRHAHFGAGSVRFEFRGKSGKRQSRLVSDERLVRIVRRCRDLPGQTLFQYRDERGKRHAVTSSQVNNYLQEITGRDFTAKDFRTWAATVFAAQLLCGQRGRRPHGSARQIAAAIAEVADRLGNTPAICRKCYIAPAVFRAFDEGRLASSPRSHAAARGLRQGERAVLALLAAERRSA